MQRAGNDFSLLSSMFEYVPALPIFHTVDLVSSTQIGNTIDRIDPSLFFDDDGRAWFVGTYGPTNPQ